MSEDDATIRPDVTDGGIHAAVCVFGRLLFEVHADGVAVHTLEAFNAFFCQLAAVNAEMAELRTALRERADASLVGIAARLNAGWDVLDARRDALAALTNIEGGGDLSAQLAMVAARDRLCKLLACAAAYQRELEIAPGLLSQLDQLAARLLVCGLTTSVLADEGQMHGSRTAPADVERPAHHEARPVTVLVTNAPRAQGRSCNRKSHRSRPQGPTRRRLWRRDPR
jgi:hypothetical protein